MRKISALGLALMIPALAMLVTASGCNKPAEKGDKGTGASTSTVPADKGDKGEKPPVDKGGKKEALTAKTDGIIKGFVRYDGTPPEASITPAMKTHQDKDVCLAGKESDKVDQTWLVSSDKGVANVVIYLKEPAGKTFSVTDELKKPFAKNAVLDQPHCAFVPHVIALYPAAGQKLEVKNSAKVPHNTKIEGNPKKNPTENITLPPSETKTLDLQFQQGPLAASCQLHPWMNAKIWTFNSPYFAVTDENGAFEIPNVPSGVELTVMVWHESFGADAREAEKKTLKAGTNDLELKVK